jgi:hypothetical protein
MEIRVPEHPNKSKGEDYTVLWVQTLGERWTSFRVYEFDTAAPATAIQDKDTTYFKKYFHKHVGGWNNLNKISPNGAVHDEIWNLEWTPVPIDLSGNIQRKLILGHMFKGIGDGWISGIAFSTNPWNHYKCSIVEIFWEIHNTPDYENLGTKFRDSPTMQWNIANEWHRWNNQQLSAFYANTISSIKIPFINNGKDKIFYIVEHNNDWGASNVNLRIKKFVNNTWTEINLGNLYTTFNNPFATHFNSKMYQKYYGVRIPKEHLPQKDSMGNDYLDLLITPSEQGLYVREVGTHDESPF